MCYICTVLYKEKIVEFWKLELFLREEACEDFSRRVLPMSCSKKASLSMAWWVSRLAHACAATTRCVPFISSASKRHALICHRFAISWTCEDVKMWRCFQSCNLKVHKYISLAKQLQCCCAYKIFFSIHRFFFIYFENETLPLSIGCNALCSLFADTTTSRPSIDCGQSRRNSDFQLS